MHLRHGEIVQQTVRRHLTPFILKISKIAIVVLPLYAAIFYIGSQSNGEVFLWLFAILSLFVGIVISLIGFDYLLDRLIVTNRRVVWINWKSIIRREEHEAELLDIQDIESREKGILSKLHIFNYGFLEVETAASKTCIIFNDCPNPEGMKHFILSQMEKARGGIHAKNEPLKESEEWSVN